MKRQFMKFRKPFGPQNLKTLTELLHCPHQCDQMLELKVAKFFQKMPEK